jgi:hypothetical protein
VFVLFRRAGNGAPFSCETTKRDQTWSSSIEVSQGGARLQPFRPVAKEIWALQAAEKVDLMPGSGSAGLLGPR